ncbi:MAG: thiamine pyrophosphate-binding protein [Gammaproteobacteria bacterium]
MTSARGAYELGDLLVSYLERIGVEYVFGIPGGPIEPLFNALARSARRGGARPVVARHESGAAFMADGYARQTGRLGVCCATTGPGTTNLITGIACAYEDQIPMLAITAQTALAYFGRGASQESSCTGTNTVGMFQFCTRYNTLVSHADQFEHKLVTAIMTAFHSPNGPAHLSIPLDVLRSQSSVESPSYDLEALINRFSLIDYEATDQLCELLEGARKVVFVIGNGCAEAIGTILEVAVLIKASIVATPHGKGLVSPYHPLFQGVVGFAGHDSANKALTDPNTDVVVAIGTKLGEWSTGGWDCTTLLNERLVHIESVEGWLTRSPMAKLNMRGRILTIFEHLLAHMRKVYPCSDVRLTDPWRKDIVEEDAQRTRDKLNLHMHQELKCFDDSTPIKPQRLMRALSEIFPPTTCYLADMGNSVAWAIHYLHPFDPRMAGARGTNPGFLRTSLEFATMAWAIGAAIGTALGHGEQPVVCITGDGAVLMGGQEITVAVQERLPIVFVILNDAAYGMVKHGQRLAGGEPIGYELPQIDFAAYAKALGAQGYTIRSAQDLFELDVSALLEGDRPTVLDVLVDREEIPPMRTRIRVLQAVK